MHLLGLQTPLIPSLQLGILHRDAVITSTQSHIQNQLQRKHEELQQLIMKQQEELQLVSEQLHLAQHGTLPITQMEPQFVNRHQIRTPHQIEKSILHVTDGSTIEPHAYVDQSINPTISHSTELQPTPCSTQAMEQIPQVHSSQQEFHNSKMLTNYDDTTNPASISSSNPASISSTIGSIKFTSTSE